MENIEAILKSMNENLELIAAAILKATVGDVPAFVKVAQDVLETANKAVSEAVVEEVKTVAAEGVNETPVKVSGNDLIVGTYVKAMVEKKTRGISVGHTGQIIDDNNRQGVWRTVDFDGVEKVVKMRCGELEITEKGAEVPNEAAPTNEESVIEEVSEDSNSENKASGVSPDAANAEGANYTFTAGAHKNNTVHGIYTASDRGAKFITWSADKHKDEAAKSACVSYLKVVNL